MLIIFVIFVLHVVKTTTYLKMQQSQLQQTAIEKYFKKAIKVENTQQQNQGMWCSRYW